MGDVIPFLHLKEFDFSDIEDSDLERIQQVCQGHGVSFEKLELAFAYIQHQNVTQFQNLLGIHQKEAFDVFMKSLNEALTVIETLSQIRRDLKSIT
jgi:hypothetical protein